MYAETARERCLARSISRAFAPVRRTIPDTLDEESSIPSVLACAIIARTVALADLVSFDEPSGKYTRVPIVFGSRSTVRPTAIIRLLPRESVPTTCKVCAPVFIVGGTVIAMEPAPVGVAVAEPISCGVDSKYASVTDPGWNLLTSREADKPGCHRGAPDPPNPLGEGTSIMEPPPVTMRDSLPRPALPRAGSRTPSTIAATSPGRRIRDRLGPLTWLAFP